MKPRISVIGIGNILMSDEGVGVRVVERLKEILKDENVEIFDGGNMNFQLLEFVEGRDAVIFVDAVDFQGEPGDVKFFRLEEVKGPEFFSIHDLDYTKVIALAKTCGIEVPEKMFVVGIKPKKVSEGLDLSPEVQGAVDKAAERVTELVKEIVKEIRSG